MAVTPYYGDRLSRPSLPTQKSSDFPIPHRRRRTSFVESLNVFGIINIAFRKIKFERFARVFESVRKTAPIHICNCVEHIFTPESGHY